MSYRDVILAETSLVAFWEAQETSGTNIADTKGVQAGTLSGSGHTIGVNGPYPALGQKACRLTSASYINIPENASLRMGATWTIEIVMKSASATPGNFKYIFNKWSGASNTGYGLYTGADEKIHALHGYTGNAAVTAAGAFAWDNTEFHIFHATYKATSFDCYADGVFQAGLNPGANTFVANTAEPLMIGAYAVDHTLQVPGDYCYAAIYNAWFDSTVCAAHLAALDDNPLGPAGNVADQGIMRLVAG